MGSASGPEQARPRVLSGSTEAFFATGSRARVIRRGGVDCSTCRGAPDASAGFGQVGQAVALALEVGAHRLLVHLAGGRERDRSRRTARRRGAATWRTWRRNARATSARRHVAAPAFFTTSATGRSSHFGCGCATTHACATPPSADDVVLEVDRGDPLAAALHQILRAVADDQVLLGVDLADVAGDQPAVVELRGLRILEVLRADPRSADQDLADRFAVVRQALELVVEDVDLESRA